jgi:hypothetical protein
MYETIAMMIVFIVYVFSNRFWIQCPQEDARFAAHLRYLNECFADFEDFNSFFASSSQAIGVPSPSSISDSIEPQNLNLAIQCVSCAPFSFLTVFVVAEDDIQGVYSKNLNAFRSLSVFFVSEVCSMLW